MINANSIAEMRTYGEGFVIVDQSPAAVDISAIKNTNTKIVMRLPEALDCESIGRSIGLNDEQIMELSKLDKGVAAIFQNDWLEAVLTKIDRCSNRYEIDTPCQNDFSAEKEMLYFLMEELIKESQERKYNQGWLMDVIKDNSKGVNKTVRQRAEKLIAAFCDEWKKGSRKNIRSELIMRLLNCDDLMKMYEPELPPGIKKSSMLTDEIKKTALNWVDKVYKGLDRYMTFLDPFVKDQVFLNIILYQIKENRKSAQYKVVLYCVRNRHQR